MATSRRRVVRVAPFTANRRIVAKAMAAGRRAAPMVGLLDLDVTDARRLLAAHEPPLSFTAFVVASVARAAAAHPEVHAYRNWRGQLVTHEFVDVATLVEIETTEGPFGLPCVLQDADVRTVADLSTELRQVKARPATSPTDRWRARVAPIGTRVPGATGLLYAVMARSVGVRRRVGTVAVSAVGMFGGGGGHGIAPMTIMSLEVVVGGMSPRPRAVDGRVEVRDVLDLSVAVDHRVVDGGPVARFAAELRQLIEAATVLR